MSAFWQKAQVKLQPTVARERLVLPGKKVEQGLLLDGIDRRRDRAAVDQGVEDPVLVLPHPAQTQVTRRDAAVVGAEEAVDARAAPPLLPERGAHVLSQDRAALHRRSLLGQSYP